MDCTILSVGQKPPAWVQDGYQEYVRRLPHELRLTLIEVPPARRTNNCNTESLRREEARSITRAIPANHYVIALDEHGRQHTTMALAEKLRTWIDTGTAVCFVIGGPDGLDPDITANARETWSLSEHTLPHALVRVILAEQIYRAWCILRNHPYHRE